MIATLKRYNDCRERCACFADAATGEVAHEYKHVKTTTRIPIGGTYRIERDDTVTILTRVSEQEFSVDSHVKAA